MSWNTNEKRGISIALHWWGRGGKIERSPGTFLNAEWLRNLCSSTCERLIGMPSVTVDSPRRRINAFQAVTFLLHPLQNAIGTSYIQRTKIDVLSNNREWETAVHPFITMWVKFCESVNEVRYRFEKRIVWDEKKKLISKRDPLQFPWTSIGDTKLIWNNRFTRSLKRRGTILRPHKNEYKLKESMIA